MRKCDGDTEKLIPSKNIGCSSIKLQIHLNFFRAVVAKSIRYG
jgi:hypothetical protein